MRTASICPTCSTYENALCILYNGTLLPNTQISPLDSVQVAFQKIDANLVPVSGTGAPTASSLYLGQFYVRTSGNKNLYYAQTKGSGAADWRIVLSTGLTGAPEYANNAAAIAAGLTVGQTYRTGEFLKIVY